VIQAVMTTDYKMSKEQINFKVLFRSPKYPAIVISEDGLFSAYNIKQLGTLCVLSETFDEDYEIKVIDSSGQEFIYFQEHTSLMPGILNKNWTKKQIIELYNNSVNANETNIKYPLKSLSNKKLSRIIGEICELLKS
jgi:hypothetical protein